MASAAGIKSVRRDHVFFSAIKGPVIKSHRRDATLVTAPFCSHFKAKQIPPFMAGVNFFHDHFYFIRQEFCGHDVVFVRKDVPNIIYGFRTGDKITPFIEHAVHRSIYRHVTFSQCLHNRRSDKSLQIARLARTTSSMKRFGQFTDRLRECSF